MIKLKNLLWEELTDADIKVGDAHKTSGRGLEVNFVYGRKYKGWETLDYQFKPQYGEPGFMGVGTGPAESVDGWDSSFLSDTKIN